MQHTATTERLTQAVVNVMSAGMKITTWNVNGMRAALRKGFDTHMRRIKPTVLLLQETRALPEQLPPNRANPRNWHVHWHSAEKKGYAGTAIWSRHPIEVLSTGLDAPDPEGRVLRVRTGGVQVVSVYLPSGSRSEEAQVRKDAWMGDFADWMRELNTSSEPVVVGGDLNIAHTPDDIHNPTGNKKTSGFLPHEREWFSGLLDQGWKDTQRTHVGLGKGPYSWWSNRGQARELNRGWRIDYLLTNPACPTVLDVSTDRKAGLACSDHAPVTITLDHDV
ncbi:MAG: exodeoxyribonuclease-3 [Myxococcota bacterium]|jgi:exodeoxyribonuclease-3